MLEPRVGFGTNPPQNRDEIINVTITMDSRGKIHQNTVLRILNHFGVTLIGDPEPTDDLTSGQKFRKYLKSKIIEGIVLYLGSLVFFESACHIYGQHVEDILTSKPFDQMIDPTKLHDTISMFQSLGYENYVLLFLLAGIPSGVHLLYGYIHMRVTESNENNQLESQSTSSIQSTSEFSHSSTSAPI